jgi:phosphate-selective porin OprO/OprP
MLWRIQLDFNTPEDPEYKDVYIGFKELPWNHTILVGNQKRPLGLDQE